MKLLFATHKLSSTSSLTPFDTFAHTNVTDTLAALLHMFAGNCFHLDNKIWCLRCKGRADLPERIDWLTDTC